MVGESGCGKTTTILALMGLLPPTATVSGSVLLAGEDLLAHGEDSISPHRWTDIAMVFQGAMNAFNPVKRIGDQIAEPMELHGLAKGGAAAARVRALLEPVGISAARADRYPHELSGGMRQRAAIAMALACAPHVLLADEPTTALDVMVQAQILELLPTCRTSSVSPRLRHARPADRRPDVHARGRDVRGTDRRDGPTEALYHETRHPYTRMLWAATPDLDGGEDVVSIPGVPPRLDTELDGCPFAPRCNLAASRCTTEHPELLAVGDAT